MGKVGRKGDGGQKFFRKNGGVSRRSGTREGGRDF